MGRLSNDRKILFYLFLLGFFAIFSTTISKSPVLPLFAQALGSGNATLGMISAVSPFAGILFSFPVGVLSDKFGRRRLLIVSGAVFVIAPLLYLLISDPLMLIPVRFFHGLGTAILGPVAAALLVDRFPGMKGEVLGQYSSATLVGRSLAPLTGGVIISYFAMFTGLISYQVVYVVAFLFAIPAFVITLLYSEKDHSDIVFLHFKEFTQSFVTFFGDRVLRATAFVEMATYFSFGAFETFLPVFLFDRGFSAVEIGFIFSGQVVLMAATKPLFGRVADRVDKRVQIIAGLFMIGVSVAIIPYFADLFVFLLISIAAGLGLSLSTVATGSYIGEIAAKKEIGASMGALSSTMDIGHSLGPLVTGLIIGYTLSYQVGFMAGFLLTLATAVFFIWSAIKPGT
ncbi:MAG: MFS transporter [Methanomicrobiales archaeon]|nr:MFS transporter [Methanomicrobiales archaeon]